MTGTVVRSGILSDITVLKADDSPGEHLEVLRSSASRRAARSDRASGPDPADTVQSDPLLFAKLSPSVAGCELLARPRLSELVSQGIMGRLTLLSAPAGFGKTTVLSQWRQQCPFPVAWLTLNSDDDHPTRFWTYFVVALQSVYPNLGASTLDLLRSSRPLAIGPALTTLANEIAAIPKDLVVVLDDLHLVGDQAIYKGLTVLLDSALPGLHVVIATRHTPALPLARLRARRQLTVVSPADLAFTHEETSEFFNEIERCRLSRQDVVALQSCTEGWIVGLQTAVFSLKNCEDPQERKRRIETFAGDETSIMDFLIEEIVCRQPKRIQSFLLQTSIIEPLTGALCEAVAGLRAGEGHLLLETLLRANLIRRGTDGEREGYRYHQLLASALKARLRQVRPGSVSELHHRASAWYLQHNRVNEAIGHSIAAGEFETAANLSEQLAETLARRGEMQALLDLLRSLPDEHVRSRPLLCIWHAYGLFAVGQLGAAEARLRDAERHISVPDVIPLDSTGQKRASPSYEHIQNLILLVRANISAGQRDIECTIELSNRALASSVHEDDYQRANLLRMLGYAHSWNGNLAQASEALMRAAEISDGVSNVPTGSTMASYQLARIQVIEGQLRHAAMTYRQALRNEVERFGQLLPYASAPCLGLALLHFEWNEIEVATQYAHEGVDLARRGGLIDNLLLGETIQVRLKQAQGDLDGALEIVNRLERLALSENRTQELERIRILRARLWLLQGDFVSASEWAQTSWTVAENEPSFPRESCQKAIARVWIACGDFSEAARILKRLLNLAESTGRKGSVIKILGLYSLALQGLGRMSESLNALAQALSLAQPEGYVRSFIDLGVPLKGLLLQLLKPRHQNVAYDGSARYVRTLLEAFASELGQQQPEGDSTGQERLGGRLLSNRELEVLRLIAEGRSFSEIAGALIVSQNTVRTHYKNIYGKLNAHTRAQAIAKARTLKLL